MYTDTCSGCGLEYPLMPQSEECRIYLFLETHKCDSVVAKCPGCGFVTRMFSDSETIMQLIQYGLKISVCMEASPEILEGYVVAHLEKSQLHQEAYEEWCIEQASDEELRHDLGL